MGGKVAGLALVFAPKAVSGMRMESSGNTDKNNPQATEENIFGEVSVLFRCRRTATVKSTNYCEGAYMDSASFTQLLANYPYFYSFLIQQSMRNYDDELRCFLVFCLRRIDYLEDTSDEILMHLAMFMVAEKAEKNSVFFGPKDEDSTLG